jgi:hypothetical protein
LPAAAAAACCGSRLLLLLLLLEAAAAALQVIVTRKRFRLEAAVPADLLVHDDLQVGLQQPHLRRVVYHL